MEYIYKLKYNTGIVDTFISNIQISRYGRFRHKSKSFQVIESEETPLSILFFCREIDDEFFYNNYAIDTRSLRFEESITDFFSARNIFIKPSTLNEDIFKKTILELLSPFFHIKEEVWGKHFSGKKMKIDAFLSPKFNSDWRNKNLSFGIEFKNPLFRELNNRRDTDALAQCLDYAMSEFHGYQDKIIFLCPLLPGLNHRKLLNFLTRYNTGYIDFFEGKILFKFGTQTLWQENRTTPLLRNSMLKSKYGNRGYK